MAKYWAWRIAAAIVPRVPMWIARPVASAISWLICLFAGDARHRVERNLRHIPGLADDHERFISAVYGVFQTATLNYLDFLRGAHLSDAELRAGWTIENQEAFDAAMAEGRGLVLLSGHFGNFEFAASRLAALGHRLIIPAERMRPEPLFELFCRLREHHGLRIVPADSRESLRELLDALKRNEVDMFLADRYVAGQSVEAPFFGTPARMPTAPVALALRSGAPVMTAYSWREGAGRSHGIFFPLEMSAAADTADEANAANGAGTRSATATRTRAADETQRALRIFLDRLEAQIAAHPEQWVAALAEVWPASGTQHK
jgi:lauroyl/myristoyl acyltransferase